MRMFSSLLRATYRTLIRPIAGGIAAILGLVPALLAGAGVFFIVAGLFTYLQPANASTLPSPTPTIAIASVSPGYTVPPLVSLSPGPSSSATTSTAVATRIKIPALGIDMPIIQSPANEEFPLCDTAEFMNLGRPLGYPGSPQSTYIYAHARTNMFLPLLSTSQVNNGASMVGMWVEIYTDDNQRHVYEIAEVIRHVPDNAESLSRAAAATTDQLWLQTSEGPYTNSTKLQVVAQPVGVLPASATDAHPAQKGVVCPGNGTPICKKAGDSGCRTR